MRRRHGLGAEMEEGKGTLYHTTEQRISTTTEELEGGGKRTVVSTFLSLSLIFGFRGFAI